MGVTNYYSVNGEIIGEKPVGGTRTDYLSDALGSVMATVNQSAQVVNTYRYKPYGALLAKTGVGADPSFQWVGSQGYRQTSKKFSDVYVRARHYDTNTARWTTVDPLWPNELAYIYAACNPSHRTDPLGLFCPPEPPQDPCKKCRDDGKVPGKKWMQLKWASCINWAIGQYCDACPGLDTKAFLCQIFAESDGDPNNCTHNPEDGKDNCGLFQISKDLWDQHCKEFGPFAKGWKDPCLNIFCAIKIMCQKQGNRCKQCWRSGWGTDCSRGNKFDCCKRCKDFDLDPGWPWDTFLSLKEGQIK